MQGRSPFLFMMPSTALARACVASRSRIFDNRTGIAPRRSIGIQKFPAVFTHSTSTKTSSHAERWNSETETHIFINSRQPN